MMLNIGQLLDDAQVIRETLLEDLEFDTAVGMPDGGAHANEDLERIDRIIAYFQERCTPPSEPGSYKQARGIIDWQPGDEPAEESVRRIRGGDDTMNEVIRRHNKPAL